MATLKETEKSEFTTARLFTFGDTNIAKTCKVDSLDMNFKTTKLQTGEPVQFAM